MKIDEWKQKKQTVEESKQKHIRTKKYEEEQKRKEKLKEEQEWKNYKVKQYQLQKELQHEEKQEIAKLERKHRQQKLRDDQETKERIFKREEDQFRRRAELVITKKCIEEEQQMRLERTKFLLAESKFDKVESKLGHETKAAQGKKRGKFKVGTDEKKDAMTFGGRLTGPSVRAQPSWRKGL